MKPSYPKLALAGVFAIYFLWIAYDPMQGSFLDNVDLAIHETGHLIFRLFGEFMMIAGGSLFQVLVPLAFVAYFVFGKPSYFSAAIVLFWVGQSVLNVYVYAADAVVMQLVLTSGFTGAEGSFHDWNYLLNETGFLGSTKGIARTIRFVGTLTIIAATVLSVFYALNTETDEHGDFE